MLDISRVNNALLFIIIILQKGRFVGNPKGVKGEILK